MARQKAASQAGQGPFLIVFKQDLDLHCLLALDPIFFCLLAASKGKDGREGIVEEQSQGPGKFRHSPGCEGRMDLFSCSYRRYKLSPDFMVWQRTSKREARLELTVSWQEAARDRAKLNEIAPSPQHFNVFSRGETTDYPEYRNPGSFCSPQEQPDR